ncbi:hypothetical protein ASG22_19920 [Chryseobacterium sp. Leaf405]|uniref:hypothetical protein n=1 Tax=Chryseobacterium sp. Leaf405 TaxID=1736367 RepID=UPI0007000B8A|nr:hypothetical protein [Chryseobacterium sp. Leaf405]KQT29593.1 hypothetical protein ASG22_19920 [Chryseobacterium sp. Leaf405]
MNDYYTKRISILTALISFSTGTALLIFYYTEMSILTILNSFYVVLSLIIINVFLLLFFLFKCFQNKISYGAFKKSGIILSANVPVAILYLFYVNLLLSIIRVTVVNHSGQDITNIKVTGCENKAIAFLENDASKTVWIDIPQDCSVDIHFQRDGKNKNVNIIGYATSLMGQKVTYEIK